MLTSYEEFGRYGVENMDVADFGLSNLRCEGAQILAMVNSEIIAMRVIALFPGQTEPEHWHTAESPIRAFEVMDSGKPQARADKREKQSGVRLCRWLQVSKNTCARRNLKIKVRDLMGTSSRTAQKRNMAGSGKPETGHVLFKVRSRRYREKRR